LNTEGDEEIKENYLAPSIAGDKIGCLCITEPFGGSDVAGMKSPQQLKKGISIFLTDQKPSLLMECMQIILWWPQRQILPKKEKG
jgi:hypothetical protein